MRCKWLAMLVLPFVLAFGFAGCEVEQAQEGELPDAGVDVEGGQMPVPGVDAGEIEVNVVEEEVAAPDLVVDVDEEAADVVIPDFEIITPEEEAEEGAERR